VTFDELFALLGRGTEHADEELVDLLDHSLQCAALLAERHPGDRELQIAGLVHDIGTILHPDDPAQHASTGAAAVAPLLGHRVARLVSWHADAKRYLVTTDAGYRQRLSARSIVTLEAQGGAMSETEVAALAAAPDLAALLELRRADDDAKVIGLAVPALDTWRPLLTGASTRVRGVR
jgi:predicted HD phosphohydrolase